MLVYQRVTLQIGAEMGIDTMMALLPNTAATGNPTQRFINKNS
jgi:hypothetical protein